MFLHKEVKVLSLSAKLFWLLLSVVCLLQSNVEATGQNTLTVFNVFSYLEMHRKTDIPEFQMKTYLKKYKLFPIFFKSKNHELLTIFFVRAGYHPKNNAIHFCSQKTLCVCACVCALSSRYWRHYTIWFLHSGTFQIC